MTSAQLDAYSLLALYTAMALYAISFVSFTIDLARRTAVVKAAPSAKKSAKSSGTEVAYSGSAPLRVGVAMAVFGWVLQFAATILRGIAAERVPWANMYEFALTGTLIIMTVFLSSLFVKRIDFRFIGTFIVGLVLLFLGLATVNFYLEVVPLPPALQSVWLVIHVFVAAAATGVFALGFALSVLQLIQLRRESGKNMPAAFGFLRTLPSSEKLESVAFTANIIGFVLWTFTLVAGAIWAERAWSRYWGWDTKEVWTFIIWVLYAGYIHARATRGWEGKRAAWLSIIGFSAIIFNYTIVNLFFKGLHAYSGL